MSAGSRASNRRAAVIGFGIAVPILLVALIFVISGGIQSQPKREASPQDNRPEPTLVIVGSCSSTGGELAGEGVGFTPNSRYVTKLFRLEGSNMVPYTNFESIGQVNSEGRITTWTWSCAGDRAGRYVVHVYDLGSVTDEFSHPMRAEARFEILSPPGK